MSRPTKASQKDLLPATLTLSMECFFGSFFQKCFRRKISRGNTCCDGLTACCFPPLASPPGLCALNDTSYTYATTRVNHVQRSFDREVEGRAPLRGRRK
eukprot:25681-Chlamydomonas_euryale.AAC.3